jgi:GxxExxY protein
MSAPLLHQSITDRILGEYYKVFNELRFGFREEIYQRAMVIALTQAGLTAQEQVAMRVWFRGISIGSFVADIVVERVVLLEIKATKELETRCAPQALNYLSASDLELALILNFGEKPEFKRLVLTNDRKYRPGPPNNPDKTV